MRTISIAEFARQTKSTLDEADRAIKISLFNGVIDDTRVDEGRLKGNWQTSTGSPITTEIDRLDPNGTAAKAQVQSTVKSGSLDIMTNNLPYAPVYEEKDAMIRRNLARIETIVRQVTRR